VSDKSVVHSTRYLNISTSVINKCLMLSVLRRRLFRGAESCGSVGVMHGSNGPSCRCARVAGCTSLGFMTLVKCCCNGNRPRSSRGSSFCDVVPP
jgi:hypothetical protein